jgi:hypothetical protein
MLMRVFLGWLRLAASSSGLIQLAWRFLMFQKDSALARWYRTRTEGRT